jgi:heat shock protein HslJ
VTRRLLAALALLLAAMPALAACSSPPDLEGRTFVAASSTGHELVEGSRLVLVFSDGTVGAQPGCNSMSAPATWDDGVLRLTGQIASTRMACSEDLMAKDDWFAGVLGAEPTLELDGDTLTLSTADVSVVLVESV